MPITLQQPLHHQPSPWVQPSPWIVRNAATSLDGLSDKEFKYRYGIACGNRKSGDDALSIVQIHAMVAELARWPRGSNQPHIPVQETQRDRMDYADWLKLLHEVSYKPSWQAELVGPNHSHPWATISLCVSASVDTPSDRRKITKTYPMCEEMFDKMKLPDALRLLDQLITECELAIKDVWLKHNKP